jgi:glucose-6-phosphate isomerase
MFSNVGLGWRSFSLWSAVGLTISLAIDNFDELLSGANEMDDHFKTADFDQNMPVVLALLSIWYNNFFGAESEALITIFQNWLLIYNKEQWKVMVKVWVETGNLLMRLELLFGRTWN